MQYKFADFFARQYAHVDVQSLGETLERMRKKNENGVLLVAEALEHAHSKRSILNGLLTWNEKEAAEKYRKHQMRKIISSLRTDQQIRGRKQTVPAFVKVRGSGYYSISDVLKDKDLREEMRSRAMREAAAWSNKWEAINELCNIHDAIEKERKKIKRQKRAAA